MATVAEIIGNLKQQLALLDPAASVEDGTPEAHIIESVAEVLAQSQVDFTVLDQMHDITAMTGNRLDSYLGNFGFGRQGSVASIGSVTFSRNTPATTPITIFKGTRLTAHLDNEIVPTLTFTTTDTGVIGVGETGVTVPVICTTTGTIGNVPAHAIDSFSGLQTIVGITKIDNTADTSGGLDGEDDTTFRSRFINSVFRNLSGTLNNYMALALTSPLVTKANVVGPISRYQEYVQIPTADDGDTHAGFKKRVYDPLGTTWAHKRTSALSTIPYSQHTYVQNNYLTNNTVDVQESKFFRENVDYVFNTPAFAPPTATAFLTTHLYAVGDIVRPTNTYVNTHAATETIGVYEVTVGGTSGGSEPDWSADNVHPDSVVISGATFTLIDTQPNVTFLNPYGASNTSGNPDLTEDDVVLLEHQYISSHSRNNYALGILNCIDIFINGTDPAPKDSVETFPTSAFNLQNTDNTIWTYQKVTAPEVINFKRVIDGRRSTIGSRIQPLFWQPVVDVPDSLIIAGNTFYKANFRNESNGKYYNAFDGTTYSQLAQYIVVEEVNSLYGSIRARNGIEWFIAAEASYVHADNVISGGTLTAITGQQFTINSYKYDANIGNLQTIMEQHKQVTTDVLVHKARKRFFTAYLTIIYDLGAPKTTINASINETLKSFFNNRFFGAPIQLSDILQAVHNVPGVDNVRWTRDHDNSVHRITEVNPDGRDFSPVVYYDDDFFLQDSELADAPDNGTASIIRVKAQNTWGTA